MTARNDKRISHMASGTTKSAKNFSEDELGFAELSHTTALVSELAAAASDLGSLCRRADVSCREANGP